MRANPGMFTLIRPTRSTCLPLSNHAAEDPCLVLNASSSGCSAAPSTGESATAASPELDFSRLPNVLCLAPGAVLSLRNVRLVDIAHADRWAPAPAQPLRNAGVGFPLWPTLTLQAGASVRDAIFPFACSFLIRFKINHPGQPAAMTLLDFMRAKHCFVKLRRADVNPHLLHEVTQCRHILGAVDGVGFAFLHKTVLGLHEIQ
jgi:hypothetical protein